MSIREFLKEKPRESDILAFLQQDNKDKNDYLDELRNDIDKAITQNRNNISIYNIQDQNLTNPLGHISQYKRDLYDYENNQEMNADDLSDYILDKQSQFNASKPIFADDNEVARKSNQFMRDLGDELQKSGRGKLLQDSDGSYWVKDVKGNYAKVQGSLIGDLYRGIRDNGASVALGTAGAIGGGMLGGGVGMVAGGALGASLGAGYDYYGNTKDTNQEANLKEALMLMGENAGLSLVGDAAFAGVAKGARALKNTYAMAKAGSAVGKDMIDGIALKGNNLKENIGDRFRSAMPTFVNDALSSGLDTTKNYVKEILDEKQTGLYNNLKNDTYLNPIEVNQGNVYADLLAKKAQNIADMSKNNLVKNISQKTADISTAISKNIGSKETALSHQELLNMSFMDNDLANVLAQNVKDNPQLANKLLNALSSSDKALLDELGISDDIGAKILYDLKESRAKRAYDEFGAGLDKLEKLNPNGVEIDKQIFRELADNAGVYSEATPTIVRSFLKRLDSGELDGKSVKQIYDEVSAISDKLKGEQSYNYKEFLNSVKDELLNSLVKNSSDPKLAKEILEKTRSDYAKFKKYYDSEIGKKLDGSEEDISKKLNKLINNTNDNKNYEAITKGLNPQEVAVIDEEFIKRNIAKYTKEFDGKKVLDYESFLESTKHFNPKSETGKIKMETLKAMGRLRKNMKPIYQSLATTKMEKQGKSIATTIDGRAMMMFINQFSDYIAFYFGRMFGLGKQAGMRIQYRRMVNNINNFQDFKTQTKEFINSIKDKYIKEQAQKLDAEFKAKVKDLIKGDNFYMDKPDPKDSSLKFIGKNGKEYIIDKNARSEWMKTFNLKSIDDDYIPNIPKEVKMALKDREIKLTKGSLLKLVERDRIKYIPHIKDTLENPQVVLRDKDDFVFIKNIDNQTYFTSIGKDYETHLTIISNSPKKQNNIRNKMKNAKVVYYNNARALPTSRASSETKQVSFSNGNSTQDKPKENLIEKLKEDRKNKKSVKEKLDEKIKNQKESDEDKWKRFDNFLKENKDYDLDVMGNLDVVTREFILNAKKKTRKGKKADIPDLMRSKIENELNIKPLKEFGKNYAEYYHDGKGALQKLLIEKQGQVAGAFHRKDLGDIDLVWGEVTDKIKHKGYGLAHIIDKHPDFYVKMIDEIVEKGEVKKSHNGFNIIYKDYRLGLNEGWNEKGQKIGNNKWVVTAFEKI
ncbi:hypothetical protein UPTC5117_00636 [Campylobacter lari]|uniref:putative barnase/colicin E5 family endoribonuclease n=1 Tax=Campylobacter lari TaxID=201 RepID=UPI002153A282|nr:PBECR2 nuclease fold domain-containing protein [Campylobacter lari]MCR6529703.1 PBECR2 nuclease fold domain-containing protein [Campylobacter lari]